MTQPLRCLSGDLRAELLAQAAYNDNDVALLFNVPTATLVAWKAHQTRGTYSAAASPELRHG